MDIIRAPRLAAAAVLAWAGLFLAPITPAAAAPCPDIEVVFARGTAEPAGVGGIGQSFINQLQSRVGTRSVVVYPVDYPASDQFGDRLEFAKTVVDGVRDAGARVQSTAARCPDTRIVLGGFSQGAVVAGFVTSASVPDGVPADLVPAPLSPSVADHVAAVVLFGMPSAAWMRSYGAPPVVIGPLFADKTIQLCNPGDSICDGAAGETPTIAHVMYGMNGMADQAAAFAAGRL